MLKNTNILMIRHAEKPDSGAGLSVAGQKRAQAYVIYFQNYLISSKLVKLNYLFAAADSSDSQRPRLTIHPLSTAIGLGIIDTYKDEDYSDLAGDIRKNSIYDQSNILICWHHANLLKLAAALGVKEKGLPSKATWPVPPWPGKVFGWLLQLCYDPQGEIIPAKTLCINQQLMYDDYCKNPPTVAKKQYNQLL